jgi:hypothetical protein
MKLVVIMKKWSGVRWAKWGVRGRGEVHFKRAELGDGVVGDRVISETNTLSVGQCVYCEGDR